MKKLIIALLCLTILGATITWFFLRSNDNARDALPADATVVAVIEPAQFVEGLGLNLNDFTKMASVLCNIEGSIDFTKPFYAFTTEKSLSGFTFNVEDADELLKCLTSLGYASEEQNSFHWIANNNSIGCIDENKMLLCFASTTQQDELRNEMTKLMKQAHQDLLLYEKANKQTGFLKISSSLSSLPKKQMPLGFSTSGAFLNASLAIGSQDFTLSANLEDEDGEPYNISSKGEELLRPIEGLLPTARSANPFAWLSMGVKGEQILKMLRRYPKISTTLMAMNVAFFDADQILKAIEGDVIIMMPKADEMLITARISNSDFLNNAKDWDTTSSINGMSLRKRGPDDDYVFNLREKHIYFGVRGELLYIASTEKLANQILQESETDILFNTTAGKYISGSLDIAQLINASTILRMLPVVRELTDAFESVSVTANSPQSIKLSVHTSKPIKEIVPKFCKLMTGD